jgi:hypothetical protein
LLSVSSNLCFPSSYPRNAKIEIYKGMILSLGITGFWKLSIVRYSKEHKSTWRFGNWICFCIQLRGWETPTLLGLLERTNLYIWALFSCRTQQYTNQLTHISLCIIEFIGRTMLLHVSAHGPIFRRYINNLTLLNYAYMDPYIILIMVCYNVMSPCSLEYRTMDGVRKPSNRDCYPPSPESFRIHFISCIAYVWNCALPLWEEYGMRMFENWLWGECVDKMECITGSSRKTSQCARVAKYY